MNQTDHPMAAKVVMVKASSPEYGAGSHTNSAGSDRCGVTVRPGHLVQKTGKEDVIQSGFPHWLRL